MNLDGLRKQQLLAALGACLAGMLLAGPAAARPDEGGGANGRSEDSLIVNQRQLELAGDTVSVTSASAYRIADGYQPQLGGGSSELASAGAQAHRPDGYQPQLGGSELTVVADGGFDWAPSSLAASLIAAMLLVAVATFTYGNRRGYRSA